MFKKICISCRIDSRMWPHFANKIPVIMPLKLKINVALGGLVVDVLVIV
jgi:hypothetical protein